MNLTADEENFLDQLAQSEANIKQAKGKEYAKGFRHMRLQHRLLLPLQTQVDEHKNSIASLRQELSTQGSKLTALETELRVQQREIELLKQARKAQDTKSVSAPTSQQTPPHSAEPLLATAPSSVASQESSQGMSEQSRTAHMPAPELMLWNTDSTEQSEVESIVKSLEEHIPQRWRSLYGGAEYWVIPNGNIGSKMLILSRDLKDLQGFQLAMQKAIMLHHVTGADKMRLIRTSLGETPSEKQGRLAARLAHQTLTALGHNVQRRGRTVCTSSKPEVTLGGYLVHQQKWVWHATLYSVLKIDADTVPIYV